MRRSTGKAVCAAGLLATFAGAASAQTKDTFALDQFNPAPAGDRFFGVQGDDAGGHVNPRLMLLGDYAYRPLVLYRNNGDSSVGSVVSDQLFAHLGLGLGLWDIFSISADLPIALVTHGNSPALDGLSFGSPSGAALGDLRLGARLRFVGAADSAFQLSLAGYAWLPTGDKDKFAGDGQVRGTPVLVAAGEAGSFVYAANAGITLRQSKTFAATKLGTQLVFGGAAGLLLADKKLQIGPELYGNTTTTNAFDRDTTNLEAILGLKYRAGSWVFGAGAGPGITRGLGTPAARVVGSIAYAPVPETAPADRDHDGILDADDACPDDPGIASDNAQRNGCPDRDKDGIFDQDDACVDVKGVADEDPKKNGCPPEVEEPDTDKDGILDKDDACVDVKGVANDDPKKNGCPPDRDGDGIIDAEDACPDLKGIKSSDPEQNGCPGDTDGDGIRDDKDACPNEKGKPDPDPSKNGCPKLVRVTNGEIVILQQVQFKTASDVILPVSDDLLEQVSGVLREHPEVTKLEVQGHTDNRGNAAFNKALSQRRAASVVKWLTKRGQIDASRLIPQGYGMDQPIDSNDTDEGRQKNRRVQFKILESSQPGSVKE